MTLDEKYIVSVKKDLTGMEIHEPVQLIIKMDLIPY